MVEEPNAIGLISSVIYLWLSIYISAYDENGIFQKYIQNHWIELPFWGLQVLSGIYLFVIVIQAI